LYLDSTKPHVAPRVASLCGFFRALSFGII
jgi:hypothetical protein